MPGPEAITSTCDLADDPKIHGRYGIGKPYFHKAETISDRRICVPAVDKTLALRTYETIRNNAIGNTRDSRKDAKAPRFGEISKCLTLRASRLGGINFRKVVLLNISKYAYST
jgi:hypothetical protein